MRNKVHKVLRVVGRDLKDAGAHMYHARDGIGKTGAVSGKKQHKYRKALHKQRMRASGMSDDIFGSKEVGGRFENRHEKEV